MKFAVVVLGIFAAMVAALIMMVFVGYLDTWGAW